LDDTPWRRDVSVSLPDEPSFHEGATLDEVSKVDERDATTASDAHRPEFAGAEKVVDRGTADRQVVRCTVSRRCESASGLATWSIIFGHDGSSFAEGVHKFIPPLDRSDTTRSRESCA